MWLAASTYVLRAVAVLVAAAACIAVTPEIARAAEKASPGPSAPSNLTLTDVREAELALSWTAPRRKKDVAGYGVYVNSIRVGTASSTRFTFSGLTCGTSYPLGVDAFNADGMRSEVVTVVASTSPCPDTRAPTAPTNITQTGASGTSVALMWTGSIDDLGVAGYGAYVDGARVATTVATSHTFEGLGCGRTYGFGVDSVDGAGNRSAVAEVTASTAPCPDTTAATPPANLTVTAASDSSLSLAWTTSYDDVGVVGYGVYVDGANAGTGVDTRFNLDGLACATSYTIGVDAFDAAGNRSAVASVVARTTVCPPAAAATCSLQPYDAASPWNRPIPADVSVLQESTALVGAIADSGLPLTSDPDQYAIAVYNVDGATPLRTVKLSGYFSTYDAGDDSRVGHGFAPTVSGIPIPDDAVAPAGTDGQLVLVDPVAGVEYGFWQFGKDAGGNYTATNGYRYHTTAGYYGRFADGKAGRGAGLPYLGGLVRPCEIAQGKIEHALAFAYNSPSSSFVYPASKSDGVGRTGVDLPEGSRLQLNPALGEADFDAWGLSAEARVIARALQTYGMYVVDNSGSSKVYLEARHTAGWDEKISRSLLSNIPWSHFRVVAPPAAP